MSGVSSQERLLGVWGLGLGRHPRPNPLLEERGFGAYTLTRAIIAADSIRVPAITRKTMGQGWPAMSSSTLNRMACAPA